MCAHEIRLRIRELDIEIDLQNEVLKKLHHSKSCLQRQLNAIFDPISRLPLEISSEIFIQSLPTLPKRAASHVPMLLLNICSAWSAIAPQLWQAIRIDFPCADGMAELLSIWFQRGRSRPLTVVVDGDVGRWNENVSAVIWKHRPRLRHLEILDDWIYKSDYDHHNIDLRLGHREEEHLPLLEHLTFHGTSDERGCFRDHGEILELLYRAPNLVECVMDIQGTIFNDFRFRAENPDLPFLRSLTFGEQSDWYGWGADQWDDAILNHLTLPALEALSLPMRSVYGSHLRDFLERSAPPLQQLTMSWKYRGLDVHLHECLHLIPTLAKFTMWEPDERPVVDLIATLADFHYWLPNLRHLTIHMGSSSELSHIYDWFWLTLLRAVSQRRIQLDLFPRRRQRRSSLRSSNLMALKYISLIQNMMIAIFWSIVLS
ncbi:F-box domain-containing protein [Mycena sanguinolenta]|uniref:F-box domain-containing protein n=1 Tax=Mycena sanguinolenta TaxID=230812 RepID=A0A8H6YKH9_9AGAR|nr:F-box domain-containing protein [Mycena sanguinolenta]